jgi:hypothetical protein
MEECRYWVALFKKGRESAGIERELARHNRLDPARSIYRQMVADYPARLVMLCDRPECWPAAIALGANSFIPIQ